jgi:hypothetical protein
MLPQNLNNPKMICKNKVLPALLICVTYFSCSPTGSTSEENIPIQLTASPPIDGWPKLTRESRPWTRWWWMGNAVNKENINHLLSEYAEKGIGGVEIAPIYGAIGYEDQYIDFLSPQWMDMLDFTVKKADSLNMGVDMTQGTGWPFGGPQVKPEHAASKLIIQTYQLRQGQSLSEPIVVNDPKQRDLKPVLQAVMAYNEEGKVLNITDNVSEENRLIWSPTEGSWEIYAAWNGKTRQMVKRAAPGGVGYTLDHLSKEAVKAYLGRFEKAFKEDNFGVRAFYNDSYEVYNANWTSGFFKKFQERRGYDLRPYIKQLVSEEETELIVRLKSDYRETMAEMLLENFTIPWTEWAHAHNSITKNQAHGSPGNLLDLYAAVDIPEGETFGSSYFPIPGLRRDSADIRNVDPDPIMLKFASSAANVKAKKYASSETFTWLGEHFKTSYSQMKPELEQVFLSGINHIFYHGVTYSPEEVAWPGWLFYASINLTPANSLWPHFNGFNTYVNRVQSVLQAGTADNELMVYWPVYDVYSTPEGLEKMIKVHDIDEWLHPTPFYKQSKQLMEKGYSLDFVSDRMLSEARVEEGKFYTADSAPAHKVLIIPQSQYMPVSTFERIIELAKEGGTVILQALPQDVPGLHQLEERRARLQQLKESLRFENAGNGIKQLNRGNGQILLAKDVQKVLDYKGIQREALTDTGLKFIRRDLTDGKYYYLVNHMPKSIDTQIPLNVLAESVVILDPQSGKAGLAASLQEKNTTLVKVQMQPGEALILRTVAEESPDIAEWKYLNNADNPLVLDGEWSLKFTEGGPELPDDQELSQLTSWPELSDPKAEAFSGSGVYTTTFNLPSKEAGEYILDLGNVRESARVWINGEEVGLIWSIPFQARIRQYLKEGENTLKVEVANLMANRIRNMDRKGIEWRKYHEINFVNIDYKPFDASVWKPTPSGLLGPVTITPYETIAQ